jgi:tetratricopeptide (TPR) repeat protein
MLETYAVRLSMTGRDKDASALIEPVYKKWPDNPRWIRMMGVLTQDRDPSKSVELLKREFELTGNAETLTRMARGYQLMRRHTEAKDHYFKALKLNPLDTLAICNLFYQYKISNDELFEAASSAIKHGLGVDDQYFLCVAVQMANALGRVVPEEWIEVAVRRVQMVRAEGGFANEATFLPDAIAAWIEVRPDDAQKVNSAPSWFKRKWSRFFGVGVKWVPKPQLASLKTPQGA